jgi:nitrate/nitrite transporter NarK
VFTTVTNKGRFHTLALTFLCQSTQALFLAGLPLLLPLIRQDLGLTFSQAGSLASASLLVYALMQIPAGYLSDRRSPRKLVAIGTLGMMGLSILLAFTREYWQLLGIQFFWGFFSSFTFTPAMSVFIRWFSSQRRTTATALPSLGPGLGIFSVNLLFPVIVNRYDTWRLPFIMFGVAGIFFALGLLLFGKDATSQRTPEKFRLDIIREIFRRRQVWICYTLQFIRFGIVQGISFWLPSLLLNEKQFPLQLAGTVIALQAIISAPANIFGAYFSDRFKKPTLVIGVSLVMLGITTGLLVPLNSTGLVIAVILVNAIFIQMYFGPLFTIAVEMLGPEKTGISNGVSNMFAIFGGLVSAYLMGVLRDATGSFEWGFYSICVLCAIGLILTFILEKVRQTKAPLLPHRHNS